MNIIKPHHTNYCVSDLDRSIKFYRDGLGFELVQDVMRENIESYDVIFNHPGMKIRVALFQMPNLEMFIELFEMINPRREEREQHFRFVGSSHVAYQVEDIDAFYTHITGMGYTFLNPPVKVIRDGQTIAKGAYLEDPDGLIIEIFECAPEDHMVMPDKE